MTSIARTAVHAKNFSLQDFCKLVQSTDLKRTLELRKLKFNLSELLKVATPHTSKPMLDQIKQLISNLEAGIEPDKQILKIKSTAIRLLSLGELSTSIRLPVRPSAPNPKYGFFQRAFRRVDFKAPPETVYPSTATPPTAVNGTPVNAEIATERKFTFSLPPIKGASPRTEKLKNGLFSPKGSLGNGIGQVPWRPSGKVVVLKADDVPLSPRIALKSVLLSAAKKAGMPTAL